MQLFYNKELSYSVDIWSFIHTYSEYESNDLRRFDLLYLRMFYICCVNETLATRRKKDSRLQT